jgi:16S rRNA (guanine527-N7)-methyltransferase
VLCLLCSFYHYFFFLFFLLPAFLVFLFVCVGLEVLDIGCGGGFPGVPLAIIFPKVNFTLLDSIAKKTKAVQEVVSALQLPNVKVVTLRAEKVAPKSFDKVIGRAVVALPQFLRWAAPALKPTGTD